jgi:hypothetical protein
VAVTAPAPTDRKPRTSGAFVVLGGVASGPSSPSGEKAAGLAHEPHGLEVVSPHQLDDVPARPHIVPQSARRAYERTTTGNRLEAPNIAALTDHIVTVCQPDVPNVARGAPGAPIDLRSCRVSSKTPQVGMCARRKIRCVGRTGRGGTLRDSTRLLALSFADTGPSRNTTLVLIIV